MRVIQFIINGNLVIEKHEDLFLNQIDEIKWDLAKLFEITPDDVEVVSLEVADELSSLDVSDIGLVYFNGLYPNPIVGMSCMLEEGSDEYLDAMNNGTLLGHIKFVVE